MNHKPTLTYKEYQQKENAIWKAFLEQASQAELLQSIATSNWDGNSFLLNWIRTSPNIDHVIARAAYWMGSPRFFKQFKNREDCLQKESWAIDDFDVLEDLEYKIMNKFYTKNELAFDPTNFLEDDWTLVNHGNEMIREIPKELFQKQEGVKVNIDYKSYTDGLPNTIFMEIDAIFDKFEVEPED
jgi:hypothetical protein